MTKYFDVLSGEESLPLHSQVSIHLGKRPSESRWRAIFGKGKQLVAGKQAKHKAAEGNVVAVFGKQWGKEVRVPGRKGKGRYFVDWVLAKLGASGQVEEFVAIEVQTIDTTGSYRTERDNLMNRMAPTSPSVAGLNWENVSKRILPQLIIKGHILQREPLCKNGIFFVCPTAVYDRIMERLGGKPEPLHRQPGSITFRCYDLEAPGASGTIRHPRRLHYGYGCHAGLGA